MWKETKGILSYSLIKKTFLFKCLLQTGFKNHTWCLPASLSHKQTVCVCTLAYSRQTHAQTWRAYQRFSLEDTKDKTSYEPKSRNGNKQLFLAVCNHDEFKVMVGGTMIAYVFERKQPWSLLLRCFIWPQQEVQCANSPLSDWTLNHVNTHLTCLHHTMQVSNPRLDNHTPSP